MLVRWRLIKSVKSFVVRNYAPSHIHARHRELDNARRAKGIFDGFEMLEDRVLLSAAAWQPQGPAPAQDGQVENISPNNEVVGALHTVVAHPTDANILYVGGTNGGIWKTTNAKAASPTWTPLIDDLPSLSIGAMQLDPTDATNQTLVAGIGRYSSFAQEGGARIGLVRTSDGGANWSVLDGGGTLVGKNISGVAARGSRIVVSVNTADNFTFSNIGIFRSVNGGATFTRISVGDGSGASGLPEGASYDLVSDPRDNSILYTNINFNATAALNGIYKSSDTGATWTKVSDAAIDALISFNTSNLEMAVGNNNNVYVGIINNGNPVGFFRSGNGGATWTQMDSPSTNENGTDVGLNPRGIKGPGPGATPEEIAGGQGNIHFSIIADPNNANIVYVGGDRQPLEFQFPTSIGATEFSGRLFRGDASAAAGSQWVHLTHSNAQGAAGGGTANNSAPHADSREMTFDASGDIIEVDDGGVYRRTNPRSDTGRWLSINGNLQVTEAHDVAYDTISDILLSGNQDTGSTEQINSGSQVWRSISTADGGDVAVDNITLAGVNQSIRYSSFQNLGAFQRRIVDSNNNVISSVFPALTVVGGGPAFVPQFDTPIALNAIDPRRIMFGGFNGLYESTNQGNTIAFVGANVFVTNLTSNPIAYGGRSGGIDNLFITYAGDEFGDIHVRTTSGSVFASTDPDTASSDSILDVRMDPDEWGTAFAVDADQVFMTTNAGVSWSDITGSLASDSVIHSLEYISGPIDAVVIGTNLGVFSSLVNSPGTWNELGAGLPNAPVWDMVYDATDDILAVATLGRGVWTLPTASIGVLGLPDIIVTETGGGTIVNESGTTDTFGVALDSQPLTNLLLTVVSGDIGEATVNTATLLFTPANWNNVKTVTVTGVDDTIQDGDRITTIIVAFDIAPQVNESVRVTTIDDETVKGTNGDDVFRFTELRGGYQVQVNKTSYFLDKSVQRDLAFLGLGGKDLIVITGAGGNETANVRVGSVIVKSSGFDVSGTSMETIRVIGGTGNDRAKLYDSPGNDFLTSRPAFTSLTGKGFDNRVSSFDRVEAFATAGDAGGVGDRAALYDSSGNEKFISRPGVSVLSGSGFYNRATGFDQVDGYSRGGNAGGVGDRAYLYDSLGNDLFYGRTTYSYITGKGFTSVAHGFDKVYGIASGDIGGPRDRAFLYDSARNDTFTGRPTESILSGRGFYNKVTSFDKVVAYASKDAGGKGDQANLYDSTGNDKFYGRPTYGYLTGRNFFNRAEGFDTVNAYARAGSSGRAGDQAFLYDSSGNDVFVGRPDVSSMTGPRYFNQVTSFDRVYAIASKDAGGRGDRADLYDSAGNDTFFGRDSSSYMTGTGFYNRADGFDSVLAHASTDAGGIGDRATVYDSPGNDTFFGRKDFGRLTGKGFLIFAEGFDRINAFASRGGIDTIDNRALSYLFLKFGKWEKIV